MRANAWSSDKAYGHRRQESPLGPSQIRHEECVANKHRIANLVGDVRRRVARDMDHLDFERAKRKSFAVGKEVIEFVAINAEISGVEHRTEDLLNIPDVFADAHLRAGLDLDVWRIGEMVGMGMGFEQPYDLQAIFFCSLRDSIGRCRRRFPALMVVVEDRTDDSGLLRFRIGNEVAHGVCRLSEEGANGWDAGYRNTP